MHEASSGGGFLDQLKGEATMKLVRFKVVVCLVAIFVAFALPSYSQTVSATLGGRVTDSSGGVIPKATVTAVNNATKFSRATESSDSGEFSLTALPAGDYTVTAEAKGFRPQPKALTLQVGQVANLDFSLGVGEMQQQVTVEATSEVTEPTRTNVSSVIVERQIENLPVNGRQFIDFALLSPAVQIGDTTSGSTDVIVEPVTKLSFAGQNIHYNFIAVDGADDISTASGIQRGTPPQESVQEFRVVNTSYSVEFGRAVAGVVNIITKSGTNTWHGSLYDYFRNNAMDAKSILQAPGLNILRQNQFGASIGGPIQKDKTFLFANYEGQRRGESPYYNSVVLANSLPNPANPGSLSNIDNVKVNVFGLPPEPAGLNVLRTGDQDNGLIRVDHSFSDREYFTARYFVTDGRFTNQSPLNNGFDLPSAFKNNFFRDQSLMGSLTSSFTPTLINELRMQWARRSFDFTTATTQPHLEVANTFAVGVNRGNPDFYREKRFELVDNVTKNLSKHTISFGGNFNYVSTDESFPLFYPFEADFGSLGAFLGTDGVVTTCATAPACPHPFVIFFQRNQASSNFTEPTLLPNGPAVYQGTKIPDSIRKLAESTLDHTYNGFYIQDKWRATNRLTINGGIRWEFETWPSAALNDQYRNFDPRLGLAYNVGTKWNFVVRAGMGLFHGIIPSPLLACQKPSCGGVFGQFTSPVTGLDRTAQENNLNANVRLFAFASSPAITNFAESQLLSTGTYPDFTTTSPFGPGGPCVPLITPNPATTCGFQGDATIVRFNKNHKNPYGVQSTLTLEFEPLKDTQVSVSYLRIHGVHLGSFYNVNQPPPSATILVHNSEGAAACKNVFFASAAALGPGSGSCSNSYPVGFLAGAAGNPGVRCILPFTPGCNTTYAVYFEADSRWRSQYDGLLINVNKRLSHHFSAGISYTWAKSIDDGPNPSFVLIPQDSLNINAERTISADDVRNRFVGNAVLSSPTTGNMFFRDFQLGFILTLQSPQHFTKYAGSDVNGDVFGSNDRVGLENRNTFKGDTLQSFDLRASRSFTFKENKKIEFIAEVFNIANTVNIRYYNTNYGAADFCPVGGANVCGAGPFFKEGSPNPEYGTPSAVFNPRQIQLALRLTF
jgi:hypothetical protein